MTNRDPLYYEGEGADLANEMMADAIAERESELGPEDYWWHPDSWPEQ
ncbi:hypothetical protein ACFWCM_12535 [Streptomyces albidoflavus]